MAATKPIVHFSNQVALGESIFRRWRQGEPETERPLLAMVKELFADWTDRRLAHIERNQRALVKRLCYRVLESGSGLDARLPNAPSFLLVFFDLAHRVFAEIVRGIETQTLRVGKPYLQSELRHLMSLDFEDRIISAVVLQKPMAALIRANREGYECINLKYIQGMTYEEIATYKNLTIQQVRTQIKKAFGFVRTRLQVAPAIGDGTRG